MHCARATVLLELTVCTAVCRLKSTGVRSGTLFSKDLAFFKSLTAYILSSNLSICPEAKGALNSKERNAGAYFLKLSQYMCLAQTWNLLFPTYIGCTHTHQALQEAIKSLSVNVTESPQHHHFNASARPLVFLLAVKTLNTGNPTTAKASWLFLYVCVPWEATGQLAAAKSYPSKWLWSLWGVILRQTEEVFHVVCFELIGKRG